MNTALNRRLAALERRTAMASTTVRLLRDGPWPEPLEVRFITAEPSHPQPDCSRILPVDNFGSDPVDKSEKPITIIDLEPGEDLNSVARELGISPDELHRQRRLGLVRINFPMPEIPVYQLPKRGPVQVFWPMNL